jgi:hypothetical protein
MCSTVVAQGTKNATRQPLPKATQAREAYSNTEFDPSVSRLPVGFNGNNIIELFAELEKTELKHKKREFESTVRWEERVRLAETQTILGKLGRNSTYAFVVQQGPAFKDPSRNAVKIDYDADSAKFDIAVDLDTPSYRQYPEENEQESSKSESAIIIFKGAANHRSYIGSNGFGAKREVNAWEHTEYEVLLSNSGFHSALHHRDALNAFVVSRTFHIAIPMPLERAKTVKPQIRVLVIGKLSEPFVSSGSSYDGPTIDDPIELSVSYKYVQMDISAIWVYNHETGTVYVRRQPTDEYQ